MYVILAKKQLFNPYGILREERTKGRIKMVVPISYITPVQNPNDILARSLRQTIAPLLVSPAVPQLHREYGTPPPPSLTFSG